MSHFDYTVSRQISMDSPPFYALIMAAMRQADTDNRAKLNVAFPETARELQERYDAPGGVLPHERQT